MLCPMEGQTSSVDYKHLCSFLLFPIWPSLSSGAANQRAVLSTKRGDKMASEELWSHRLHTEKASSRKPKPRSQSKKAN